MSFFLVNVSWLAPYPKSDSFRVEGSGLSIAASRALRAWRKKNKGKRLKEVTLKITKL